MLKEEMEEKGQPIMGPDTASRKSLTHVLKNNFHLSLKHCKRKVTSCLTVLGRVCSENSLQMVVLSADFAKGNIASSPEMME